MSVVVTGAAGFIGTALVHDLVAAGYPVTAIDRRPNTALPAGARELRADLLAGGRHTGRHTGDDDSRGGDRDGRGAVRDALATAEAVFHLAGRPGVRDGSRRLRDNVLATAAVLRAVPATTTLVVASSSSVYGGSRHGRPSAEGDPVRPRGGYAGSKVLVEQLCRLRLARGGSVAIARPFTVVGERQRPDMALARWVRAARNGDPLTLYGSPLRTRDITDVRDAATALRLMAERDITGPLNIGTGRPRTLAEIADAVRRATNPVPIRVVPARRADPPDTRADTRLARRLLGFTPTTDLAAVLERVLMAPAAR